jgi:octaprenyl-diphosphate synthase
MTESMPNPPLGLLRTATTTTTATERTRTPADVQLAPVSAAMALVADDLAAVEACLGELLQSTFAIIPSVGGHLAFAGGKRFRPMATLLAAQAAGYDSPKRVTVAAAAELLHTATLLHDDVIDEGEFRRGRPAARLPYGNGLAVLTGDYCYARALQAVAYLGAPRAIQTMADAVTRMAEGEVAQLHVAGESDLDRERYYLVIDRKTAALISWCSAVAHLVEPRYAEALARYGREVGYAFQIADDIIDYSLDVEVSGKTRGQDLREGKTTLPLILACERRPSLRGRLDALLRPGPPIADDDQHAALIDLVIEAGGLDAARRAADTHVDAAVEALDALPATPARDALEQLARYIVERTA